MRLLNFKLRELVVDLVLCPYKRFFKVSGVYLQYSPSFKSIFICIDFVVCLIQVKWYQIILVSIRKFVQIIPELECPCVHGYATHMFASETVINDALTPSSGTSLKCIDDDIFNHDMSDNYRQMRRLIASNRSNRSEIQGN